MNDQKQQVRPTNINMCGIGVGDPATAARKEAVKVHKMTGAMWIIVTMNVQIKVRGRWTFTHKAFSFSFDK